MQEEHPKKEKKVEPIRKTSPDLEEGRKRKDSMEFNYGDWNSEDEEVVPRNPLVFYFQCPYYLKDDDLETIIKYLEDQFSEDLKEFKFIFIFKVLNGSNF